MPKSLKILVAFIASWLFFFPLIFIFLPAGLNSKMLMAVVGVIFCVRDFVKDGMSMSRECMTLLLISLIVSMIAYAATVVNNTDEVAYVTYFVSMSVWLSAAYASFCLISFAHGRTDADVISDYIIALCTVQCIVALLIEVIPSFGAFVKANIVVPEGAAWESRLIGLGVAFDTAGTRMSAALVICANMIVKYSSDNKRLFTYMACFAIIVVLGNMMSRTTTVGALIAIGFLIYKTKFWRIRLSQRTVKLLGTFASVLIILVPSLTALYQFSPMFRDLIGFGFEGFINYIESGTWETRSNNALSTMWSVWPTTLHTWLIGDGYFADPNNPKLFYMGTDVGYARLLFLFGIFGLMAFVSMFIYLTSLYMKRHKEDAAMFFFLLMVVFAIWVKVSTDIFLVFAFYFFATHHQEEDLEEIEDEGIV